MNPTTPSELREIIAQMDSIEHTDGAVLPDLSKTVTPSEAHAYFERRFSDTLRVDDCTLELRAAIRDVEGFTTHLSKKS